MLETREIITNQIQNGSYKKRRANHWKPTFSLNHHHFHHPAR
jgi:hypothetical protein